MPFALRPPTRTRKSTMYRPAFLARTHLLGALLFTHTPAAVAQSAPINLQVAIDDIDAEQRNQRLAPLARFPQGEWRTTPANGVQQRDVWTWGPARHALTSITSNSQGTSQSVLGGFRVIHHHPSATSSPCSRSPDPISSRPAHSPDWKVLTFAST